MVFREARCVTMTGGLPQLGLRLRRAGLGSVGIRERSVHHTNGHFFHCRAGWVGERLKPGRTIRPLNEPRAKKRHTPLTTPPYLRMGGLAWHGHETDGRLQCPAEPAFRPCAVSPNFFRSL